MMPAWIDRPSMIDGSTCISLRRHPLDAEPFSSRCHMVTVCLCS